MKPAPLLLTLFLAWTPAWAQEPAKPHVDWEGNPLPAEAVARAGSARFRPGGHVNALALSPDEKMLASLSVVGNSTEGVLTFWDAATGRPLRRFPVKLGYWASLRFGPDGKTVALFSAGIYRVLDVHNGKELKKWIPTKITGYEFHALSQDGRSLAIWEHDGKEVTLFDLVRENKLCTIEGVSFYGCPFSHDGKTLAMYFSPDLKNIGLFDTSTGKLQFDLGQSNATHVAVAPDGTRLAALHHGDWRSPFRVAVWDLTTRKLMSKVDCKTYLPPFAGMAFSPDGKQVFLGLGRDESLLVDAKSGKVIHRLRTWSSIQHAIFTKDGDKLYTASHNSFVIQPWTTATGKRLDLSPDPRGFPPVSNYLALHLHGRDLLLVDDSLARADWRTGRTVQRYPTPRNEDEWHNSDGLSPDGKWLASFSRGQFHLLDAKTGKAVRAMPANGPTPSRLFFSPDSAILSGYCSGGGYLYRWQIPSGKKLSENYVFGKDLARSSSISPDRLRLAFLDTKEEMPHAEIKVLESGNDRIHHTIALKGTTTKEEMIFSGSGKELAVAFPMEGKISFFDVATGKLKRAGPLGSLFSAKIERDPDSARYVSMALSTDGRNLAASEDSPTLWEVASGKVRHRFQGHQAWIQSMVFHPDGSLLAAASADAPIFIWDVYGKHLNKKPSVEQWSDAESQRYWDTLASDDAAKAFGAVRALVQNPRAALKLLDQRLQPVKPIEERRFAELVKALDDESFAKRKKALAELEHLAEQVEGWLLRETEAKQPLEVQRRLEQIVAKLDKRSGDSLRGTRALEVLEQIGGAEAERLVARLADGFAAARLTREAKETRERMRKKD